MFSQRALSTAVVLALVTLTNATVAALPIGVNIPGPNEGVGAEAIFNDLMKTARPWGIAGNPYHGDAVVDTNGWPTGDCATLFLSGDTIPDGVYKLKFTGSATTIRTRDCTWSLQNKVYTPGTNTTTADIVVPRGQTVLIICFDGTNGGLRNLSLLRPGVPTTNTPVFESQFLASLAPFSVFRCMDYSATNNTNPDYPGVTEWRDTRPSTYAVQTMPETPVAGCRYYKDRSWQYMIELANVSGKDPWINVPIAATDDYITKLATLFRDSLAPGRAVYVEYSNEIWNYLFSQPHWNLAAAQAEVAGGDTTYNSDQNDNKWLWAERRVSKRTYQIARIFATVFGQSAMNSRVRVVLPTGRGGLDYLARFCDPQPSNWIYGAMERAPYMQLSESVPAVTKDQMLAQLRVYSDSTNRRDNRSLAIASVYYRVQPIAYEGGPHIIGSDFLSEKVAANRSTEMGTLVYHDLYNNWYGVGGGLYAYYNLVGGYGSYGSWGSMERYRDMSTAPKYDALKRIATATPPTVSVGETNLPSAGQTVVVTTSQAVWGANDNNLRPGSLTQYAGYVVRAVGTTSFTCTITYKTYQTGLGMQVLVDNQQAQQVAAPNSDGQARTASAVTFTVEPGLHVIRVNITGPAGNGLDIPSVSIRSNSVAVTRSGNARAVARAAPATGAYTRVFQLDGRVAPMLQSNRPSSGVYLLGGRSGNTTAELRLPDVTGGHITR